MPAIYGLTEIKGPEVNVRSKIITQPDLPGELRVIKKGRGIKGQVSTQGTQNNTKRTQKNTYGNGVKLQLTCV